jgi:DNA modification methylase
MTESLKYTIFQGDVFECFKRIPSESVDLVLTSPPYWMLRSYQAGEKELGSEPSMEAYLDNLMKWVAETWRVLKPTGSFVLNIGDCFIGGGRGGYESDTTVLEKVNASVPKAPNWAELKGGGNTDWKAKSNPVSVNAGFGRKYKAKQFLSVSSFAYCRIVSESDFVCRGFHIWAKPNVPSPIRSRLKQSHESLLWFVKDADEYFFDKTPWMRKVTQVSHDRGKYPVNMEHFNTMAQDKKTKVPVEYPIDTIEHSWRVIPVGEKQRGFEVEGKENVVQEHVAPFPEALIKPYLASLCPPQVCVKCGNPPKKIYENTGKRTKEEEEELKRMIEEKGIPRQTLGLKIPSSGSRVLKEEKWCSCNAERKSGVVLEPFLGSGTSMKVARDLNLSCIGFELKPEYVSYAMKRVNWNNGIDGHEYELTKV